MRQRKSTARPLLIEEPLGALLSTETSGQPTCYKTGQVYLLTTGKFAKKTCNFNDAVLGTRFTYYKESSYVQNMHRMR